MAEEGPPADASAYRLLIRAIVEGSIDECRRLVEVEGANVYEKGENGWSPILHACEIGNIDIVKYLVSKGASVNDKDKNGNSCLMGVCYNNHFDILEYLLSRGANIDHKDSISGRSCLIWACRRGRLDLAEYLMSKGASIHEMDDDGRTCFSLALDFNHIRLLYSLRKWPTTMAILVLQELALIYIIDSETDRQRGRL